MTHEALDRAGSERATQTVRTFLVENGVLPFRDERLAALERWIPEVASSVVDNKERVAFTQFARWRHLRVLRQQQELVSAAQISARRSELRQVVALLEWARSEGKSLALLRQGDVDYWLAQNSQVRRRVREFLKWARKNGHANALTAPSPVTHELSINGTDEEERLQMLTKALQSETLDPRTKLAAVLLLLYGILPARIVRLRLDDLFLEDGVMFVRLGTEPLALPPRIGEVALQARSRRDTSRMFGSVSDHEWLFPGRRARYPLSPEGLSYRLRQLGIAPKAARAGALVSLAGRLPPVIISRLTGLDITSSTNWAAAVASSNAGYAASLIREQANLQKGPEHAQERNS